MGGKATWRITGAIVSTLWLVFGENGGVDDGLEM